MCTCPATPPSAPLHALPDRGRIPIIQNFELKKAQLATFEQALVAPHNWAAGITAPHNWEAGVSLTLGRQLLVQFSVSRPAHAITSLALVARSS